MKKYIKYLLLIPVFIVSLLCSFIILLRIPPEWFGCQGFGCFGLIFFIPTLAVILAVPIALLTYFFIIGRSGSIKASLLALKTFIIKPFPKKRLLFLLWILSTAILVLTIAFSIKSEDKLQLQYKSQSKITPTQNPSGNYVPQDWKVYRNEKFGYQFKYPKEWEILSTDYGSQIVEPNSQYAFTIHVQNNIKDIEKYLTDLRSNPNFTTATTSPIKSPVFPSLHLISNNKYTTYVQHHIWIEYKSTLYELVFLTDDQNRTDTISRIISSFSFFDIFRNYRFNKGSLGQIPKLTLPPGIEDTQLTNPQELENSYYVKFIKSNRNHPVDSPVQRSGVLYADKEDGEWKILFEIKDPASDKNNPYAFWIESEIYYNVVVDANGAGSGEGIGKLISINPKTKKWSVVDCFYFNPDSFYDYVNSLPEKTPLSIGVISYDEPFENYKKYNGVYTFDKSINKFVINNRIEDACTSFELIL